MAEIEPIEVKVEVETNISVPVKVVLTHPDAKMPFYAKDGDAGADISVVRNPERYSPHYLSDVCAFNPTNGKNQIVHPESGDWIVSPGQTVMLQTGLRIELLPGWEMQVRSRSGMAKNGLVVANSPGTIDSGYRGPCNVLLHNNTSNYRIIKPGTRVAQFVLKLAPQALFEQIDELSDSERGEGGFGSTGTK